MEQKSFGAIVRKALNKPVEGEEGQRLREMGYEGTWMELLSQAQVERAARGDTAAFRLLRDTMAQEEEGKCAGEFPLRAYSDDQLRALIKKPEGET